MADTKSRLAKVAIAAAFDTTGTSATITATHELFDAIRVRLGGDDRDRLEALADKVRQGVEKTMVAAATDPSKSAEAAAASEQVATLLDHHALRPSELMEEGLDANKAADRLFEKGAGLVEETNLCRIIVESVYGDLLDRAEVMRDLEPAYRRAVLKRLEDLPGEVLRLKAKWDLLSDPVLDRPAGSLPISYLLRSEQRIVTFTGREAIEVDILEWCESGAWEAVRLYTGQGGIGKTRLLIEACEKLRWRGWSVGFLARMDSPPETHAVKVLLGSHDPLFLVVDYAGTRRADLIPILREAARPDPARAKTRIVLLARGVQDWWGELQGADADAGLLLHDDIAGRFELRPIADCLAKRAAAYFQAVEDFAKVLKKPAPAAPPPPDLGAEHFGSVVFIHLAALAHVEGEDPEGADALLDFILAHERRYWAGALRDEGLSNGLVGAVGQVIALATLAGGIDDRAEADAFLRRVPLLDGQTAATRESIGRIARRLYPEREGLAEIRPDLIGEHLVDRQMADHPELLDVGIGPEASPAQTAHALTVLTRLAHRKPDTAKWLERALSEDFESLAETAMDIAVETGDPIGRVLAKALSDRPDPALASTIESKLPEQTLALRELAVAAHSIYRNHLNAQPDPKSEQLLNELARITNRLGNSLSQLGRREDALEAAEESVAIRRRLAEARPDAFLPDLASSLNDLGNRLGELGRREDGIESAEDAVAIWRGLAEARPDAFLHHLALSLNNIGGMLSVLGRHADALGAAEEAVAIYRRLAEARPDVFLPDLAGPLNNLGGILSALGRREDALGAAEEAVAIHRRLAAARPDAFLPNLAGFINNLGAMLSELGRHEDALGAAEEAVGIYSRLAEERPDAFLPDLASSLNNLGRWLSALGRREDALQGTEEAVAIYRRLAEVRPDAFQPNLAMSLNNLGNRLSELGRREDALKATEEAVAIHRRFAEARPDAFLPDLAMSLDNLGNRLSDLGRREDALNAAEEAVEIYRRLAEARADAFLPDLARSLSNLGATLSDLGRREDALNVAEEAVGIRRRLAEVQPDSFLPDLATSISNLGAMLGEIGRREDALQAAEEAVAIRRRLAEARPDAFLPDLAGSLSNLGNILSALDRREDALDAAEEAVAIDRRLAEAQPDAFLPDLAASLNNLGNMLSSFGQHEDALDAAEEAVAIYRRLAGTRPDVFVPNLARSLWVFADCLAALDRSDEALTAIRESISGLSLMFSREPHSHRRLMAALMQRYKELAEETGHDLDMEVIGPAMEMLAQMQADDDGDEE